MGFPLSCIVDDPSKRMNNWVSGTSSDSTVHVLCQRRQNIMPIARQYKIMDCPITTDKSKIKTTAGIATFTAILKEHASQGFRIAGLLAPPVKSKVSSSQPCHVIFESPTTYPAMQYAVCFHDCVIKVRNKIQERIQHGD